MPRRHFSLSLLLFGIILSIAPAAPAETGTVAYKVLRAYDASAYDFNTGGANVPGDLIKGRDGNFYGTTSRGGANDTGTLYRMTPDGTVSVLHEFSAVNSANHDGSGTNEDGAYPAGPLVQAGDGTLYGTTNGGGNEIGTFFKYTPDGTLTTLHKFEQLDPVLFITRLVLGRDGNIYGASGYLTDSNDVQGGISRFTPDGTYTILHVFHNSLDDPYDPTQTEGAGPTDLVQGSDGNFYGTTRAGGTENRPAGKGTFFRITPDGTLTTISNFAGSAQDVFFPNGALALGNDGNFYGTTYGGGTAKAGGVFRMTPNGTLTTLYSFGSVNQNGTNLDGKYGDGGLIRGSDGNFYGVTDEGGANNTGTAFRVTPDGVFTVLHTFSALSNVDSHRQGTNEDGAGSFTRLAEGDSQVFYGVTPNGGAHASGTAFQLDTSGLHPDFFAGEVALGDGVEYLAFPDGNFFGYYGFLSDPHYLYHFDLGYEYVFDAEDGAGGVYLYDFASQTFFYTSPTFPFPYLYDFSLNTVLYYYPDANNVGRYTSNPRYFYNFVTRKIIKK